MGPSSSAPVTEETLKAGLARLDELGMQGAQPVIGDEVPLPEPIVLGFKYGISQKGPIVVLHHAHGFQCI